MSVRDYLEQIVTPKIDKVDGKVTNLEKTVSNMPSQMEGIAQKVIDKNVDGCQARQDFENKKVERKTVEHIGFFRFIIIKIKHLSRNRKIAYGSLISGLAASVYYIYRILHDMGIC